MTEVTAQWVGGPEDGKFVVLEIGRVEFVIPWMEPIREVTIPVRKTRFGYRLYWSERDPRD